MIWDMYHINVTQYLLDREIGVVGSVRDRQPDGSDKDHW